MCQNEEYFFGATPCRLVEIYHVLEEPATSSFYPLWYKFLPDYGVTSQKSVCISHLSENFKSNMSQNICA
jgi:hypothetical protein